MVLNGPFNLLPRFYEFAGAVAVGGEYSIQLVQNCCHNGFSINFLECGNSSLVRWFPGKIFALYQYMKLMEGHTLCCIRFTLIACKKTVR